MDWRHNQWVGVGAAVLLVVGVVGVFMYVNRTGAGLPSGADAGQGLTFECESTGQTFFVSDDDLENEDTYTTYFQQVAVPVPCKSCGKTDAYLAYYCRTEQKYYRYKKGQNEAQMVSCPNGHEIEGVDR